jgi:hypothetical protein
MHGKLQASIQSFAALPAEYAQHWADPDEATRCVCRPRYQHRVGNEMKRGHIGGL